MVGPEKSSSSPSTTTNAKDANNNPFSLAESTNNAVVAQPPESSSSTGDENDTLLSIAFNQDGGCLAIGTASGFRICNVSPFQETFRRVFKSTSSSVDAVAGTTTAGGGAGVGPTNVGASGDHHQGTTTTTNVAGGGGGGGGGGIGSVTMLFRCNLLALSGGGPSPHYPPNKVMIWDDHLGRCIGELSFRQRVLAVKLRRDRIAVALRDRVYVYNFADLGLLDKIHTCDNPGGLLCISTDVGGGGGGSGGGSAGGGGNGMVLACPSVTGGQVRVELYGMRKTVLIDAHESALAAIALTADGTLLATASEKGTVIRLFDARRHYSHSGGDGDASSSTGGGGGGAPLREFRRGVERAKINCLCFSLDRCWLGCASDRGTVHVFRVGGGDCEGGGGGGGDTSGMGEPGSTSNTSRLHHRNGSSSSSSHASSLAKRMLPKMLSSPKKLLLGRTEENSYAQARGVPHPQACAFVPDKTRTLAVAGIDEYGSGVLLLAEFGPEQDKEKDGYDRAGLHSSSSNSGGGEGRKIGYYRFFKKGGAAAAAHAGERRRRSRHRSSSLGESQEGRGHVYIGDDRVDIIANGMKEIVFSDEGEQDGFVSVQTEQTVADKGEKLDIKKDIHGGKETHPEQQEGNEQSESTSSLTDVKERTD